MIQSKRSGFRLHFIRFFGLKRRSMGLKSIIYIRSRYILIARSIDMSGKYEHRGISTFIATLLLMVLAVAAGAIIYAYTMGYLGGLGSSKTPGTLSLDSAKAENNGGKLKITAYVRNIGKGSVTIDVAYVDGEQVDLTDVTIDEGSVGTITITTNITYEAGKTYEVKLVATDGTNLVFTVKAS